MTHSTPEHNPPTDADYVRAEIEATRAELAGTVNALQSKLDVKSRAGEKVAEVKQKVVAGAERAKAAAPEPVQQAFNRASEKAGPAFQQATQKAAPHRGKIIGGAVVAAVVLLVLRRHGKDADS